MLQGDKAVVDQGVGPNPLQQHDDIVPFMKNGHQKVRGEAAEAQGKVGGDGALREVA